MFRGQFRHTLDEKGRLSIPRRFREVLREVYGGAGLVITRLPECLVAYPWEEWKRFEEDLRRKPLHLPEIRDFVRFFLGSAEECFPDRQGRILLPAHLREGAGIEREVVVVGVLNQFEIWSPERFEERMQRAQENFAQLSSKLVELDLGRDQA